MIAKRINVNTEDLPLIAMLYHAERDCSFCVLELCFRAVQALDALASIRVVGYARLALHGFGRL